ncbi:MAG: spore maturation protein [Calditrichaeota bacterium]|nr:spore maturation protein [Calditrichota bacterium]
MLNYIWLALVVIALVVGAVTGKIEAVTQKAFEMANTGVDIALGLIGIMALWLGIMKLAEEAGLVRMLARAIRPISTRLFPDVPPDHPAMGAMVLNLAANWLGLSNAATPLGLKAMEHLQTLNPKKDTATNAMIMFLALNTGSISLIPATMIAVRAKTGAANPWDIIGSTVFSSTFACITAVTVTKLVQSMEGGVGQFFARLRQHAKGIALFALVVVTLAVMGALGLLSAGLALLPPGFFKNALLLLSQWAIPVLLFIIPVLAFAKKVKVYETFISGAKEGFEVAVKIIPYLVGILVAIGMLRASGALDVFVRLLAPVTNLIGMPAEVLPAALMRPLSGSGTLGIITELINTHGVDSFIGRLASTIYGCSETTFYVVAVYFGCVQVTKTRYAVPIGLVADAAGVIAAVFICRVMFL